MTSDDLESDLRRLWKSSSEDTPALPLDVVRRRSQLLERRVRLSHYMEYGGAVLVGAFVLPKLWSAPNGVLAAGGAVLLAGIAYSIYRLHTAGSVRVTPPELGARSSLDFHLVELERQRDLLQHVWTWGLLPLWPGMALLLIGGLIENPDRWPSTVGTATLLVLVGFQIASMNKGSAKVLQGIIERLEQDPLGALSSPLPTLTLSQRLHVWFARSCIGATIVGVSLRWFFRDATWNVPGLMQLPIGIRLFAALFLMGMAMQAFWWTLRRHKEQPRKMW